MARALDVIGYAAFFVLAYAAAGILAAGFIAGALAAIGAALPLAYAAGSIAGAYVSHKCARAALDIL
jgi:hypothetical protein